MNKTEIIEHLATESGCSKVSCEKMVSLIIKSITHGLQKEGKVQIAGFGTFTVRSRKAHSVRHPQTGEMLQLNKSRTVGFRPGSELKYTVNDENK